VVFYNFYYKSIENAGYNPELINFDSIDGGRNLITIKDCVNSQSNRDKPDVFLLMIFVFDNFICFAADVDYMNFNVGATSLHIELKRLQQNIANQFMYVVYDILVDMLVHSIYFAFFPQIYNCLFFFFANL
jgi:hypothetical protein